MTATSKITTFFKFGNRNCLLKDNSYENNSKATKKVHTKRIFFGYGYLICAPFMKKSSFYFLLFIYNFVQNQVISNTESIEIFYFAIPLYLSALSTHPPFQLPNIFLY